jgi:hypothetical protein
MIPLSSKLKSMGCIVWLPDVRDLTDRPSSPLAWGMLTLYLVQIRNSIILVGGVPTARIRQRYRKRDHVQDASEPKIGLPMVAYGLQLCYTSHSE